MKRLLITICCFVLISGCNAEMIRVRKQEQQMADQYVVEHSTNQIKQAVAKGELVVGMNHTEVRAVMHRRPFKTIRTDGTWGTHEVHAYYFLFLIPEKYLYFENGILTAWQD